MTPSITRKEPALLPKISPLWWSAFLACFVGGYLIHFYAFATVFPNSDGINRVYDLQEMTVSGRWFLHFATFPSGFMQMPAVIGFLTLVFLGGMGVLLVEGLGLRSPGFAGLAGLALVASPSLGYTFLYLFTASAYGLGMLLALASAWLAGRGRYGWGVVLLAFSMGVYQAYAPLAIGFSVMLVLRRCMEQRESLQSVALYGLKFLAYLAGGAGLYYLLLQVILQVTGQSLLPYLGMGNQGYPLGDLPGLVLSCYVQVLSYFFVPHTTATPVLALVNGVIFLLGLGGLWLWLAPVWKEKGARWRVFSVLGLCCLLPLALGFVQIISPWSAPTPLMQYPYVLAYGLVLLFLQEGLATLSEERWQRGRRITALAFVVMCFAGGWLCNLLYTASTQAHRATESYATRMLTRIESLEGYSPELPVLIIGAFPQQVYFAQIPSYGLIDHYSVPIHSVLPLNKHIYYYLNHWLNVPISEPGEEAMMAMSQSEEFQDLPLYPADGSVAMIDGQVVVRVAEAYSPKSEYEIAYENKDS